MITDPPQADDKGSLLYWKNGLPLKNTAAAPFTFLNQIGSLQRSGYVK